MIGEDGAGGIGTSGKVHKKFGYYFVFANPLYDKLYLCCYELNKALEKKNGLKDQLLAELRRAYDINKQVLRAYNLNKQTLLSDDERVL